MDPSEKKPTEKADPLSLSPNHSTNFIFFLSLQDYHLETIPHILSTVESRPQP